VSDMTLVIQKRYVGRISRNFLFEILEMPKTYCLRLLLPIFLSD